MALTDGEHRVNNIFPRSCDTVGRVKKPAQVITVTPAPSLDRTYQLHSLSLGEVHRAHTVTSEFAGKGVNVSRALAIGDVASLAVVPLSSHDEQSISGDSMIVASPMEAPVRISITLAEDDGRTTKINEFPPALSPSQWQSLQETTLACVREHSPTWLLIAGTMPAVTDSSSLEWAEVISQARAAGCSIAVDTSGEALRRAAAAGLPDVIKPNAPELAECVGRSLHTLGDVVEAAREVMGWGVGTVLVSLGRDGMLGINATTIVHASSGPVVVANTIGAGDASVAGFLAQTLITPEDLSACVANAVAWGGAKVAQPGSQLTHLTNAPEVVTAPPELSCVLDEPGVLA